MDTKCKACKLSCGKAVPGHGTLTPKLIVVSDYPGRKEQEQGMPMVGVSGQLLRMALKNVVGLDPDREVYYTNVIRCFPDGADIKGPEINACNRWTNEELAMVDCNLVLIAGGLAFETLLPQLFVTEKQKDKDFSISRVHGMNFQHGGKTWVVTWNPAYIEQFRFKDNQGDYWYPTGSMPWCFIQDLKKLRQLIENPPA